MYSLFLSGAFEHWLGLRPQSRAHNVRAQICSNLWRVVVCSSEDSTNKINNATVHSLGVEIKKSRSTKLPHQTPYLKCSIKVERSRNIHSSHPYWSYILCSPVPKLALTPSITPRLPSRLSFPATISMTSYDHSPQRQNLIASKRPFPPWSVWAGRGPLQH